ncbi:MAG: diguanylate cyclase domain-containing protein [Terracidiphilus sp.]
MKRLIPAFAIILGFASAAWAAAPAPLTTLSAVHALSNEEASHALPVAFEATVTYFRSYEHLLFVQDGDLAVFVLATTDAKLVLGDRVLIKGTTRESFRPIVVSNDIAVLHHGALPKPIPVNFGDLALGQRDCVLVTMHGVIHAADLVWSSQAPIRSTTLQVVTDGGYVEAAVDSDNQEALYDLLDNEVEITGAAGGEFDDKMQQTGIVLHVSTYANIKILKRANANIWNLPVTPMNQVLGGYRVQDLTQRVRVHGTITYYQPGAAVVLQDGGRSLWIRTRTNIPLRMGDLADATGFPSVMLADQARSANDGFLELTHGEIKDSHVQAPVAPLPVTWQQLAVSGNRGIGHHYDLVSIEGQVVVQARGGAQDEYTLVADGHPFSAIYRHPAGPLMNMRQVPLGSKVRVTGICTVHNSDPFGGAVAFDILLRSFDDIEVVKRPSLLNIRNLILLVGLLLVVVAVVGAWSWTLERKVRQKAAALAARIEAEAALVRRMAQLEQRRSRILEDINGSRPLAEILEEITEMVSFRLDGARCWCEVTDGARLGNYPQAPESMRVVSEQISARAGSPLGVLSAGFEPGTSPAAAEAEALSAGARLATLAIETRRLYSDLMRRSEFDLLTDAHNRFSLDKQLDALIEEARLKASIFGLIYIDLDEFKQVNDLYGHRVGDLYLQEVALRMKRQLRSVDTLARLGGDEFAALVAVVRNRARVEEIAHRLEHSFDEPFAIEGFVLHGSASVGIALYPQDAVTKDGLLSAADAAMYQAKNAKKQSGQALFINQNPELASKNQT